MISRKAGRFTASAARHRRSVLALYFLTISIFAGTTASLIAAPAASVDRIVIIKSKRTMTLFRQGKPVRSYKVSLGDPVGPKRRQGDRKTPEGIYSITGRNPQSQYYKSLRISYPNAEDRRRAREIHASPGGDIMIHGLPNGYRAVGKGHLLKNWTDGCVAVTDEEIDEIWGLVPVGATVEIKA